MNLLCPNCQKMLTVQEDQAGQMMRCPLCSGTFTVPSLPTGPGAPAAAVAGGGPAAASTGPPDDVFRFAAAPPEPPTVTHRPESGPPPETPPGGATGFTLTVQPQVVPWIAPAALAVAFFLLFLPWSGTLVWGERPEPYTLSGWATDWGSGLGILHIILLVLTVPLAAAIVALPILGVRLPAQVESVWPWRATIVAVLVGLATFFLVLSLATGTALSKKLEESGGFPERLKEKDEELAKKLTTTVQVEYAKATVYYTTALRLAVVCHLVALAGLGLQYWLEQRGNRPLPRIDVIW